MLPKLNEEEVPVHWIFVNKMAGVMISLLVDFDRRWEGKFWWVSEDDCAMIVRGKMNIVDVFWSEHECEDSEEAFALRGLVRFADARKKLDVGSDQLPAHTIDDHDLHQSRDLGPKVCVDTQLQIYWFAER